MELKLTREIINKLNQQIEIDGYLLLISKIENNISENPDITIEACKSLIEGLSKKALNLFSKEYQSNKQLRKSCDNKLPTLVKTAFQEIYQTQLEVDLFDALYSLINDRVKTLKLLEKANLSYQRNITKTIDKIDAVRGNRGDISHGRIYPKRETSSIHFARSIISITDAICSYMLYEVAYLFDKNREEIIEYDDPKLQNFNAKLDEEFNELFPNFPIQLCNAIWH